MSEINRRDFLSQTAAAATAAGISVQAHEAAAANKRRQPVRLAVMGVNGRGRGLISGFLKFPEVELRYICDPDENVIPRAVKTATAAGRPEPRVENDFRVALDDPEVDVLVCAAPDHWHALATIWACQAGKDVYVEKPISHNIVEGRRMIEAARRYDRVVGAGTQRRSGADFQEAVKLIHDGRLGDVHFARCWINSTRPNIGYDRVTEPPRNLDFYLWAGPGPVGTYKDNLVHYHWHWRWDYGTGECGNNGIHALDIARWGLGVDSPQLVTCGGNKYFFDDDQETPDTQLATFDFPGAAIQWEHRTWSPRGIDGANFGIAFYGTEATLLARSGGWTIYRGDNVLESREPAERELAHLRNFLDCLETRQRPNADVEIAHKSTVLCHLANIAWRTRSTVRFDAATESIVDNTQAAAYLGRSYREGFELPAVV